jgi:tryptophanyl-tRNA synthetase
MYLVNTRIGIQQNVNSKESPVYIVGYTVGVVGKRRLKMSKSYYNYFKEINPSDNEKKIHGELKMSSKRYNESRTVIIELDFTYTPNEEDVYVYLKELIEDRSLSWEMQPQSPSMSKTYIRTYSEQMQNELEPIEENEDE